MNFLNEQNNGIVALSGTLDRLPILEAWKRSSSAYWIKSSFPCQAMQFKVGAPDKSKYLVSLSMQFHPTRNLWRAYIPGNYFAKKAETFYKIICWDDLGARHVCGEGLLRVNEGNVYDYEDEEYTADECYALFPDSKWRKVTVFTDSVGELAFAVDQAGIDPSQFENVPSQPYAFNKYNNLFYAVTGFIDSIGEAYLQVSATGLSNKDFAYAKHQSTGFYYRVEAFQDSVGDISLKVGDQKQ